MVTIKDVEIFTETGKGLRISIGGWPMGWLPRSQVTLEDGVLMLPRWLADEKELEYDFV